MSDVIACPDPACGAPAKIVDRWTWGPATGRSSMSRPAASGHRYTPTVDSLSLQPAAAGDRLRPTPAATRPVPA